MQIACVRQRLDVGLHSRFVIVRRRHPRRRIAWETLTFQLKRLFFRHALRLRSGSSAPLRQLKFLYRSLASLSAAWEVSRVTQRRPHFPATYAVVPETWAGAEDQVAEVGGHEHAMLDYIFLRCLSNRHPGLAWERCRSPNQLQFV
jgi:hypothetical protein